jgi:flagellar hook-basal body complex protein FliE
MPAIDPTLAVGGAGANEFSIGPVEGLGAEGATAPGTSTEGSRFGGALADQIGKLEALQADAATASRDLAAGTATDPAATVMTIERARLSMQLAAQIRTKGVEALQDIFHTTV